MKETFRESMTWLHTWAGVTIGAMLFAIFWMGTLTVFDKEVDRWMMPETRVASTAQADLNLDQFMQILEADNADRTMERAYIGFPKERRPYISTYINYKDGEYSNTRYRADTLEALPEEQSHGGSGFFFPFHFRLHLTWNNLGYWLVGFSGLAMLVLLVSGVIIHRKIFVDFFLFRARKNIRRSSLDLHNITGVLALPFHLFITVTGLIIFGTWYIALPWLVAENFGVKTADLYDHADAYGQYERESTEDIGQRVSMNGLVEQAEAIWTERYGEVTKADSLRLFHVGTAQEYVT
ncbi:MAG: PepSY-associated TM helix domain-containing protein, partial [Pseudomonadota bacterium]